jgi:hypothetical protein
MAFLPVKVLIELNYAAVGENLAYRDRFCIGGILLLSGYFLHMNEFTH